MTGNRTTEAGSLIRHLRDWERICTADNRAWDANLLARAALLIEKLSPSPEPAPAAVTERKSTPIPACVRNFYIGPSDEVRLPLREFSALCAEFAELQRLRLAPEPTMDDETAYQAHAKSPLTIQEWAEGALALRLAFMAGIKRGRSTPSSPEPSAHQGSCPCCRRQYPLHHEDCGHITAEIPPHDFIPCNPDWQVNTCHECGELAAHPIHASPETKVAEQPACECPEVCRVCGGRASACAIVGHRPQESRARKWHTCAPAQPGPSEGVPR